MKKILFVIESLHLGGAEKSLVTLLNSLNPSLYQIDLLTVVEGGIFSSEVPLYVNQKKIEYKMPSYFKRFLFYFKRKTNGKKNTANIFWKVFHKDYQNVDKVYDVAISYSQGFCTYYVAEKVNASKKYTWLNTDYKNAGYSIDLDIPFYQKFNQIVVVSEGAEKSFQSELATIGKQLPVTIIKDITDSATVKSKANEKVNIQFDRTENSIVSVGRLEQPKGFDLAVKCCKILRDKGFPVHWYIVGEGSERPKLEQQIRDNGIENQFTLVGATANPYPYMKAGDIYVQTSRYEGLGLTVIEAAVLCKPIVSTNFPTVYGILENGKTGLITEMNAEDIATTIEQLLTDEMLKNRLIRNLEQQESKDKEKTLEKINELLS